MNLDVSVFPEPADMTNHGDDALSSRTGAPDGDDRLSEDRSLLQQRLAVRELAHGLGQEERAAAQSWLSG